MRPRVLPISDAGSLVPSSAEAVIGLMHFPNDEITAQAYFAVSYQIKMQQASDVRILKMFSNEFDNRFGKAVTAGSVAHIMVSLPSHGTNASLGKAAFIASEEALDIAEPGRKRGSFPSGQRAIEQAFGLYKDVAHLWAAYLVMISSNPDFSLSDLVKNNGEFLEFLSLAIVILKLLESLGLKVEKWNPWRIPTTLVLDGDALFVPRDIDDKILTSLSSDWGG